LPYNGKDQAKIIGPYSIIYYYNVKLVSYFPYCVSLLSSDLNP
jgi:hypothetical protein